MKIKLPMNSFFVIIVVLLINVLSGCSFYNTETDKKVIPADSIEVYLARSNLLDTDFESYKLTPGGTLLAECGKVNGGRQFINEKNNQKLNDEDLNQLRSIGGELVIIQSSSRATFPEPGNLKNLFDVGQLLIGIRIGGENTEIKTAVKTASGPKFRHEQIVSKLIRRIRKLAPRMCGNGDFYGIGRG